MAATSESSNDHTVSLPLIDLRLLSQSELYTLSLSASTGHHRRSDDDSVIPKIDRSVFNESAGSRKQTFSRLRLAPRNKKNSAVPASSSSSFHIPLHIPEPVDEENSRIIDLLQQLFGVEPLRRADDDRLVPVQVEFKQPYPESAAQAFQNIPIDVVDSGQRKRKRGRPRKNESSAAATRLEDAEGQGQGPGEGEVKAVETVNQKGFVMDDVGDPFGEELIGRTQGLDTEAQLLEFLEGLHGEWGSQRKKRRIVEASDLCDLLPPGWKLVLTLMRRAGRASVVCRRYVSPDGHQFESYKDVSSYLVSLFGVQDISQLKSSYTDGSQQFSSNINMASESQRVGHVPTGGMKTDANASCLGVASTSIHSHHEKQAAISLSVGTEKLNTSDGNFNSDLALDCKLGDTISGVFRDSDHQAEDKQPLKADKNDANSLRCSLAEDRVYNVGNETLVGAIEASDAACNLYIPLVFPTSVSNNNSGIDQFADEINAVTCIKSGISNFDSQDRNTGCYETVPCGNEQVHVDNNGLGLSETFVEDHVQKTFFESSMLVPNSEGKIFAGNNLEDRHLISLLEDMESNDGKLIKDDNQQIISSRDQSEIKDISTNVKLQCSSEGSLVPSQNELKHTSINSMDRTQTSMLKDSAEGNFFGNDLPSSSIDDKTCVRSGYINNVSFNACPQDASVSGGVDFTPNLNAAKDVSDHGPPNVEVVTSCLQKGSSLNDQICTMDNMLHRSSESNLFTLTGNQYPSAFHDNMHSMSAGTFNAPNPVDAGCMKPQLGIVSCSNVAAIDAYTSPRVMQGTSQGCVSVPLGGSILNQLDKQNDDGVNKANKSCLSEKAKSEVEIFQTDSMGMPKFR